MTARVLLADDHALVRHGVRLVLEATGDFTVVAEAADGAEAVSLADTAEPDLVILDVAMARLTGLQAARRIRRRHPEVPILLLSMYDLDQYLFEALAVGASGYVLKSEADRDLVRACREVLAGKAFVYPSVLPTLMRSQLATGEGRESRLTDRENEIVKLIAEGHSSKEIARLLVISVKTVESHRANILDKLQMRDRTELTRYAIRAGLVEP